MDQAQLDKKAEIRAESDSIDILDVYRTRGSGASVSSQRRIYNERFHDSVSEADLVTSRQPSVHHIYIRMQPDSMRHLFESIPISLEVEAGENPSGS